MSKTGNLTDMIFENYDGYLKEHRDEMGTPSGAIEMLSSDGSFKAYMASLTEGLEPYQKAAVMGVAERQREFLLEESAQLGPSASIIGYAVTYFPILTDIYADPVIARVATTYPTNKSVNTVPKVKLTATVRNTDGSVKTYPMPRATYLIRGAAEEITLTPGAQNDLFKMSGGYPDHVNDTLSRINKRYFMITTVEVNHEDVGAGTGDTTTLVPVNVRPDARGQLHSEFEFNDKFGNTYHGSMVGHIDWDKGLVNYSVTFSDTAVGYNVTTNHANSKVVFSPNTGEVGRVKVNLKIEGWDVNIDTHEDFEIELQTETIQDYKDIYNIDLVRTMSEAIKTQILLNKDWDLAYFLEAAETEMLANGTKQVISLSTYDASGGVLYPRNLVDIAKAVVPRVAMVNRVIHRNFRAEPQFLLTGLRTGALLESMQEWVAKISNYTDGEGGYVGSGSSFMKQTILTSPAIKDDSIYPIYKAPNDNLSRAVIIDFIYKPLYIIEEITNSQKRTFVKSRTAMELCNPTAMGCIKVNGMEDILGPDYNDAVNVKAQII